MSNQLLFIGGVEVLIIMLVVVMLFGSKKIPELARGLAKGIREMKDASDEIKREIRSTANSVKEEVQKMDDDTNENLKK
ncbi:MAG: twin-arginine translocase TatA/TatE family subunit [Bacteroidota bacterium]|nr:twin-arginine translocase TatA/TatE family subunit [Bacteroidota bacterium]MEE3037215.1 twin-arginine translocase TatA/TatE family subunit [Bacteroidota bacterium]